MLNVGKSRIAQVIRHVSWVGILAHAGFVPVFSKLGYPVLAWFNVASVAFWVAARVANQRGRSSVGMWLIVCEVVAHAVLAVLTLGWASGFQYYLIPLIPFVMFNERLRASHAAVVALLLLVTFVGLYHVAPEARLQGVLNQALTTMNMAIPLLALGLVTFHFRLASMDVERTVAELAATDPLTGLANRRHMTQRLREEEARAARTRTNFSVILADIDHFKRINDSHGHDVGDRVLVELAQLFQSTLRAEDVVSRWGGEEFLIALPRTGLPRAVEVAERLRLAAEQQLGPSAGVRQVTLTLGVAEYEASIPECLQAADGALYRGKRAGRNRVVSTQAAVTETQPLAASGSHERS